MDKMLKYQNSDGIIQVYFDHARPRIGGYYILLTENKWPTTNQYSYKDPVVCVNVLNKNGRSHWHELPKILDWLPHKSRLHYWTIFYYTTADHFLFFLSRLLQNSSEVRQRQSLGPMLKERIVERFGADANPLQFPWFHELFLHVPLT
jgi:hypothetical protein